MTQGYYATSKRTAEGMIQRDSYILEHGKFGYGYHFAKNPKYAYDNARNPEVIVFVTITSGSCMSEYSNYSNWDLSKLKSKGYDSVQNGNEICVFETWRIKCSGYVKWDQRYALFNVYNFDFYPNDFNFLTSGKVVDINISGKVTTKGDLTCRNLYIGRNEPFKA